MLGAVDQLDEAVDLVVGDRAQHPRFLAGEQVRRQLREKAGERLSGALVALELVGVGARATRILDFLLARHDVGQIAGKLAARAPEIHLEGERVLARAVARRPIAAACSR